MNKRSLSLSVLAGIVVMAAVGCGGQGVGTDSESGSPEEPTRARQSTGQPEFVANEVIVKFEAGASQSMRQAALAQVAGTVGERIATAAMNRMGDTEGITVVRTKKPVMEAVESLKSQPGVVYAEPNWIYQHSATSNDTYYTNGSLWGMYGDNTSPANQYGSRAGEAWANNHTGSKSVHVAVIDEGVMHTHIELQGQVWVNPFDPVDGVDNDGNGYVDDVNGWDFNSNNNSVYDGNSDDHGSHVAGTIGAIGGNGLGVAGVVWNTTIISLKFLGPRGGTTTNAIKAMDYATDLKIRHGIDLVATNNSWGGGGFSQALKDAIDRQGAANILTICAAGNGGSDGVGDNNDSVPYFPASYASDHIISVASITNTGAKSGFSNYGATTVDLAAPGSGIWSTVPTKSGASGLASISGTSMATPHVTGAAALYASSNTARGLALKGVIMNSTIATSSMSGRCVTGGRLNAEGF